MRALLKIEEQFWKGDVEFYRRNMTEDALMVFAPPVGVLERAGILETANRRWRPGDLCGGRGARGRVPVQGARM